MANQARAIGRSLADAAPTDNERQLDLSICYEKVGDVLVAQGNMPERAGSYRRRLRFNRGSSNGTPRTTLWKRTISVTYVKIGHMLHAQETCRRR